MPERQIIVAGGGAAGFFAAITCAESCPSARVVLLEKGSQFLTKVRISGGGRCNVTHACFDPIILSSYYPRGAAALRGPFNRFQPRDTMNWFEARGVRLKIEPDNRVFPVTDSSQTIIDCLSAAAKSAGVELLPNRAVSRVERSDTGQFMLTFENGGTQAGDLLMLATGGCRTPSAGALAVSLGHSLQAPVPSLFTFEIAAPWLRALAGISLPDVELSVPELRLRERGALLVTHAGLSGPAVLRLSAWGARALHGVGYQFPLRVNLLPGLTPEKIAEMFQASRAAHPSRLLVNTAMPPLPSRLWRQWVELAGIEGEIRWAELSRAAQHRLIQQLFSTELSVTGKTLNRDEFVTCGGVSLAEVNFKTMESRVCPGLYFGGELLDIDGLTGGFNFQAAWTTGWIAGQAMASAA